MLLNSVTKDSIPSKCERSEGKEMHSPPYSFESLSEWNLKKTYSCRKCSVELGLFSKNDGVEKLVWLDFIKCEEIFYKKLVKLHKIKEKNKENEKKYYKTLDDIRKINNEIHVSKVKLGIKFRLEHKGLSLRHSLS